MYINHNLLQGDDSLIFYRRYSILNRLFHVVVRICLARLSAWIFANNSWVWASEFFRPLLHWRLLLNQSYGRDERTKYRSPWKQRLKNSTLHRVSGCHCPCHSCLLGRQMESFDFGTVGRCGWELIYFQFEQKIGKKLRKNKLIFSKNGILCYSQVVELWPVHWSQPLIFSDFVTICFCFLH